jgi:proteasome lid subunit RPN8/RPN11
MNEITHTARRGHICASCGMTICTGERYMRAPLPGGGLVAKKAMHSKCYTALLASASKKPN